MSGLMDYTMDVNEINKLLAAYAGAKVNIWKYQLTHRKVILDVYFPGKINEMHLCVLLASCEHINSNTSWENADLILTQKEIVPNDKVQNLIDRSNGFEFISRGGVLAFENEPGKMNEIFKNF